MSSALGSMYSFPAEPSRMHTAVGFYFKNRCTRTDDARDVERAGDDGRVSRRPARSRAKSKDALRIKLGSVRRCQVVSDKDHRMVGQTRRAVLGSGEQAQDALSDIVQDPRRARRDARSRSASTPPRGARWLAARTMPRCGRPQSELHTSRKISASFKSAR